MYASGVAWVDLVMRSEAGCLLLMRDQASLREEEEKVGAEIPPEKSIISSGQRPIRSGGGR